MGRRRLNLSGGVLVLACTLSRKLFEEEGSEITPLERQINLEYMREGAVKTRWLKVSRLQSKKKKHTHTKPIERESNWNFKGVKLWTVAECRLVIVLMLKKTGEKNTYTRNLQIDNKAVKTERKKCTGVTPTSKLSFKGK